MNAVTREPQHRGRTHTEFAAQNQLAAVQLDQSPCDRQAEAGACILAGQVICNLLKRFEHFFNLLGRNADPGIADRKYQVSAVVENRADLYATSRFREFNTIGEQI